MSDLIPSLPEGKQTMSSATVSPPLLLSYGCGGQIRGLEERLDVMAKSLGSSLPEDPTDGVTQTGWQPIETAPKDRMFIGFVGHWNTGQIYVGVCWYEPSDGGGIVGPTEFMTGDMYSTLPGTPERDREDRVYAPVGGRKDKSVVRPTHWMPLPPPPQDKTL